MNGRKHEINLMEYSGEVVFVEIKYDQNTKQYECKIERIPSEECKAKS